MDFNEFMKLVMENDKKSISNFLNKNGIKSSDDNFKKQFVNWLATDFFNQNEKNIDNVLNLMRNLDSNSIFNFWKSCYILRIK